ncbi:hypothetical protein OS965_02485 [Streptomyces sp. H27-G5]|uniref:hypothetical protein n=1 Tax=Streptomyces sp. H27-G5 TaxID=2996698 RepID=UPI00226EAB02|nr:hypothetical protein [Streptomyces sp. H27-G5]MCY0917044.1 hypothetical protein [Streptomyces sp. H27-G5]
MGDLPLRWRTSTVAGTQWTATFTLLDDTGARMNIAGKVFEFAIRPGSADATSPPLVKVTAAATVQGYLTVDAVASTVQVVISPTATQLLDTGCRPFALWMDAGLPGQTCLVEGPFYSRLVTSP